MQRSALTWQRKQNQRQADRKHGGVIVMGKIHVAQPRSDMNVN
jgi:hypothetical protein